jgi:L-fuconolactonase
MMRIDAHQHFWKYNPAEHGWMNDEMAALKRDFLPHDLKPLLATAGFDGCVAVQARQSLEETRWLLELAESNDFVKGVVGWVDLCSPELPAQLERFRKHPKLVGVRHMVQDEPDDAFMLRPEFRGGIARLAEFGMTYDVLIHPRHLGAAARLVAEFPMQPFVLDHIAKPSIAEGKISPWDADLRELAALPNICCKLSGMVTEARWRDWQRDDFRAYLDVVFDAFGAERLMIGSDWPVCTLAADYAKAVDIVMDYIQQFPMDARDGILGGNCERFYRLGRS